MDKKRGFWIQFQGIVQGVGFRPTLYRVAKKNSLSGFVKNTGKGVLVWLNCSEKQKKIFLEDFHASLPPMAKIHQISFPKLPSPEKEYEEFSIESSEKISGEGNIISPDLRVCDECIAEMFDLQDRRYGYPFINCTNCGPRYSIIREMPYDRISTTMDDFPMCPECLEEYHNPENRRFHAQPDACFECGPQLWFVNQNREKEKYPLKSSADLLASGGILCVKGIGGYHLTCDCFQIKSISRLRQVKKRGNKPLAVMGKNIQEIEKLFYCSTEEKQLLCSAESPIVLLKPINKSQWMELCAPGLKRIGVMLPYTPVHFLLMKEFSFLVMTSANQSSFPIIYQDEIMLEKASLLCDGVLGNNRKIFNPCDDSVYFFTSEGKWCIRSGRGSQPQVYFIHDNTNSFVATGGDIKNSFSFCNKNEIHTTPYGGDLACLQAQDRVLEQSKRVLNILGVIPDYFVCDLHPDYYSVEIAERLISSERILRIQHHFAHLLTVFAEYPDTLNEKGKWLGFSLDGSGFGEDETIWGGEVFIFNQNDCERVASWKPFFLPGGEISSKETFRIGLSFIQSIFQENSESILQEIFDSGGFKGVSFSELKMMLKLISKNIPGVECSSMGRIFDGVSSILGVSSISTYEGESAILLEQIADLQEERYPVVFDNQEKIIFWQWTKIIQEIVKDKISGKSDFYISGKFHQTIIQIIQQTSDYFLSKFNLNGVVLSGGCFYNEILLNETLKKFREKKVPVFISKQIPFNDQGLSVGQIIAAIGRLQDVSGCTRNN